MATPAFRAAGTAVFTANNVANPTALTPVKSGSTVNGDLMLCITESRSITATVATPTGWTLLTGFPIRSGTASGGSVYVFSRIATGGADDAPTITWTGLTTGTNGDSAGARIIAWQNAVDIQAGTVTSTDAAITTSATMPAITTTFGNALIVGIVVKINDTVHTWSVATRTERSDDHTTTGTGHGTVVADLVQTAVGASGTAAATPSTTVSSRSLAISIAMKPVIVTATVGQATETDTARRLAVPFGRATETDSALALARRIAVGRASETDTAGATTLRRTKAIGQATESDTARLIGSGFPYGTATFADAFTRADQSPPGGSWASGRASAVGATPLEVNTNQLATTVTSRDGYIDGATFVDLDAYVEVPTRTGEVSLLVRLTDENTATADYYIFRVVTFNSGTIARVVNGGAQTLIASVTFSPSFANGDALGARLRGSTLEFWHRSGGVWSIVARGTDATLTAAGKVGVFVAVTTTRLDNFTVHAYRQVAIARASETDTAGALTAKKTLAIGQATETDAAQAVTRLSTGQTIAVGQASETDTAGATTARKTLALGQASDTETAGALTHVKTTAMGQASENEAPGWILRNPISNYEDDFTGGFDSAYWTVASLGSPTTSGGRLRPDGAILLHTESNVGGNVEVVFEQPSPVTAAQDLYWQVDVDDGPYLGVFEVWIDGGTPTISIDNYDDVVQIPYVEANHKFQRIRYWSATGETEIATSGDGLTWTTHLSKTAPVTRDLFLVINDYTDTSEVESYRFTSQRITTAIAQASDAETAGAITGSKLKAIGQASDTETARTMVIVDPILRAIGQATATETAGAVTVRARWPLPYTDTFDGPALDPRWEDEFSDPGGSTAADGNLVITGVAGAIQVAAIWFAYPPEWEITFEIVSVDAGPTDFRMDMFVSDPTNGDNFVEMFLHAVGGDTLVSFYTNHDSLIDAPFDPVAHRWVRLRADLGSLSVATSPDRIAWTTQAASPPVGTPEWTDSFYFSVRDGVARIDNFSAAELIRVPLAQATEVDTALALTHTRGATIAQASDTETARTMVIVDPILRAIGQALDTETAATTSRLKTKAIAQASDTETAQAIAHSKARAIAQATESDTAAAIAHNGTLGIGEPSETDTAAALTRLKVTSLGRATETDVARALALVRGATVGQVTDLQVARALDHSKVLAIGRASELDVALAVIVEGSGVVSVETAIETETAGAFGHSKVQGLGLATDLETALALVAQKVLAIAAAAEADSAGAITSEHIATIAQAAESDEAAGLLVIQTTPPLGQAVETSTAGALILVLPDSEEEEDDVVLFSITPDMSGFEEAQERLRSLMGVDISFYWPTVTEWPADTPLNPETGRPFDPTVVPAASGYASASVRCSIVHRPIRGSVEDQTENNALARLDAKNVGLIMNFGAFPSAATEFEWLDRRYKIVDHLSDALSTARRDLAFGEMM